MKDFFNIKWTNSRVFMLLNRYGKWHGSVLLLILLSTNLVAQDPAYFMIGEDELKDDHVYTMCEGEDGVIYVGTNNGLFAYRHGVFEQIERAPEQVKSAIFNLKLDRNGDVFCMNLTGQIFQLKNNKLELFYQVAIEDLFHHFNFYFDGNNNMVIGSKSLIKIDRESKKVKKYSPDSLNRITKFVQWSPNHFVFCSYHTPYQLINDSIEVLPLVKGDPSNVKGISINQLILVDTFVLVPSLGDKLDKQDENLIYNGTADPTEFITDQSHRLYYTNDRSEFFIGTLKKGIRLYRNEKNTIRNKGLWFRNRFISDLMETRDGEILLGTFLEGIMVIPNRRIIQKNIGTLNQEKYKGLCIHNSTLYFTTDDNNIYSFKDKLKLEKHYQSEGVLGNIFYTEGIDVLEKDGLDNLIYNPIDGGGASFSALKDIWELPNNGLLIAHSEGLSLYTKAKVDRAIWLKNERSNAYSLKQVEGRTTSVCYDPLLDLIFFSYQGQLFSLDSRGQQKSILYQGKGINCRDLFYKDDILYIATEKQGILLLENDSIYLKYNTNNGLKGNSVKKIKIEGNYLYLSLGEVLQLIDLKTNEIKTIGAAEGVPKGRVVGFDVEGNDLWVLKNNDIFYVNTDDLPQSNNKVRLDIDSIRVNDKKIDFAKRSFSHGENRFVFHTNFNNILLEKETSLFYKLDGVDNDWTKTTIHDYLIEYKSLIPNTYTFSAYAEYRKNRSEVFTYSFTIKKPIWQEWWFYLLTISSVSYLSYLFFKKRLDRVNELNSIALGKQRVEKEMVASELKALRSQMNPHFIFNTLNSIQDIVLLQDIRSSNKFLGKFSDLMRKILLSSEQQFIALDEEVEILNLYLDLEKLRFGDEFKIDFSCNIPEEEQERIRLPAMFVQPYIENAIKHGLFNKKGEKRLFVSFQMLNEQTLECIVQDNGIGQKQAAALKKDRLHTGFSKEAINERIQLFNQALDKKIKLQILDLEKDGLALGTKVILYFPV